MGQTSTFRYRQRPSTERISENKIDATTSVILAKDQNSSCRSDLTYSSASVRESKVSYPILCHMATAEFVRAHNGTLVSLTAPDLTSPQSESEFNWADSINNIFDSRGKTREDIGMSKLKAMQACGVNVKKFTTHGGRSALMFAVLSQDFDFVKRLVADGANVMQENEHGETAVGLAKSLPSQEIYNFLLQSIA